MPFSLSVLDVVLLLVLLAFFVSGLRKGLFVTLGGIVGFVAGGVAAFFAIPLVSAWVPDPSWRMVVVVVSAVVLMLVGQGLGAAIGAGIRRAVDAPGVRGFDRLLGGLANTAAAALVVSAVAFSAAALGVPYLSQQIAGSQVIGAIRQYTPEAVSAAMAQARSAVMGQTIPELLEPFAPADEPAPEDAPDSGAVAAAAQSVVKITGTAFECGVNQTGSGFVAAHNRVVTNAHVVAGVAQPVVNTRDGRALPARVVHFDADGDLAVLAVDGLDLEPIPLGEGLEAGDEAAFLGYPAGGPFRASGATVQSLATVRVDNIYGADPSPLSVYQLAAEVEQGNSGGPLLETDGELSGVVFAKAQGAEPVGYALSLFEVGPVVRGAASYVDTVSAGPCSTR